MTYSNVKIKASYTLLKELAKVSFRILRFDLKHF